MSAGERAPNEGRPMWELHDDSGIEGAPPEPDDSGRVEVGDLIAYGGTILVLAHLFLWAVGAGR